MTGSSKQTTTQSTSSEPWAAAQPAMKTALGGAQSLYDSGIGGQTYGGSTVIPFAQQSTQGMNSIQNTAAQNMNGQGLSGQYQGMINSGGFNAPQQSAMAGIGQVGNNIAGIARGDMLNRQDPNFERALGAASESAANQINLGASGAGRYGSAVHQGNVAREIGNYEAGQRVNQYNTERQNQMAANSQLMGVNQSMFNAGQQGFGNLGAAYDGMKAPAQDMMGIGSMYEDLASRLKNDEIRMFEASQNAPWEQLLRLNAVASGAGAMGGTTAGQAQAPGQSPLATGLGYATGLASLFGGR